MTLANLWRNRARAAKPRPQLISKEPLEWDWNGKYHIMAMRFPNDWSCWCQLKPGEAYRQELPDRGWPALEATLAPFRTSHITCESCLFMWKLLQKRVKQNSITLSFLWDPSK